MTWELARDPLYLGYLGLAQGAPLVVFQLLAGVLADRTSGGGGGRRARGAAPLRVLSR